MQTAPRRKIEIGWMGMESWSEMGDEATAMRFEFFEAPGMREGRSESLLAVGVRSGTCFCVAVRRG
jgi:hypothetical protein